MVEDIEHLTKCLLTDSRKATLQKLIVNTTKICLLIDLSLQIPVLLQ